MSKKNRLTHESSPYLRQHDENPVDWFPWGEEALAKARDEDKPILLSVGYSACHWCHVMAHESFEDPPTAELMNRFFVNVKVDREERPDLDQLYQGVVQLMGRGGGWPLTVFLTPDLRPFFAGTYFPPQDRHGMPGFPKLVAALDETWRTKRGDVESQAERFREGLGFLSTYGLDAAPAEVTVADVVRAARKLAGEVDPEHGGFGGAPKFPNPMNVALLLRGHRRTKDVSLLAPVRLTLEKMARGGLYDQLGGGFHRYSVDAKWLVPHFEKMLYDNAQLLHLYSEMHQVEPRLLWKKVVEETVAYVAREMTSPEGGFYSAQDADSEGEEGKFFVWTAAEVREVLGAEGAALISAAYDVTDAGNFEHGKTILEATATLDEVSKQLDAARSRLFDAREKRVKPGLDDKILAGWNGLMLRGVSFAARVFDRPDWAQLAARGADFVLREQWKDGRLLRVHHGGRSKIDAFLEDYGDLALGLLGVFQATSEVRYLEAAEALAAQAVAQFWDDSRQAYLAAPKGQSDLLCAIYALHDNASPSGASTLTEAHVVLAALTGKQEPLEQASRYLRKMRDSMAQNPFAFGHLWLAADTWLDGAAELTLVGDEAEKQPLVRAFHETYAPTTSLLNWKYGRAPPTSLAPTLQGRTVGEGKASAYLCRHFQCDPPTSSPDELRSRLQQSAAVPPTPG